MRAQDPAPRLLGSVIKQLQQIDKKPAGRFDVHPHHAQAATGGSAHVHSVRGTLGAKVEVSGSANVGTKHGVSTLAAVNPLAAVHAASAAAGGVYGTLGELQSKTPLPLAALGGPLGLLQKYAGKPLGHLAGNAARDALEIPGEAVPSTYYALQPTLHGHPGETISRLLAPYEQFLKHPGKQIYEHPLGSALLVEGVRGGLARNVGRIGRTGVLGSAVKDATGLDRGVAVNPGSTTTEKRFYSPDTMLSAAEHLKDRRGAAKAAELRKQAAGTEDVETANRLLEQANRADPRIITDKQLRTRTDERQDVNEGVRRGHRTNALKAADALTRKPRAVLRPIAEGIIKATPEDLAAYIDELKTAGEHLKAQPDVAARNHLEHNQRTVKALEKDLQAVKNGKLDLGRVKAQAEQYNALRNGLDAHLHELGLIDKHQAARRAVLPAAVRNLGLTFDETKGFVDRHGNVVTTDAIKAQLAHPDRVSNPSFLSQAPNMRGAKNFFRASDRPASIGAKNFTGQATLQGTYDVHPEVYREGVARAQTLVDQQTGFRDMLGEFGARGPGGKVLTRGTHAEALKVAERLHAAGAAHQWVPVKINPFAAGKEQLARLVEGSAANPDAVNLAAHGDLTGAFHEALHGPKGQDGPWALIPKPVAERALQHSKLLGPDALGKFWGKGTSAFRRAVLATNPKWAWGNQIEASLRGVINGSLPYVTRSWYTGRHLVDELTKLDPVAAEAFMERGIGQGHYGFATRQHIHRPVGEGASTASRAAGAVAATAPARAVTHAWDRYTHFIFNDVNGRMERQFRVALAGKYAQDHLLPRKGVALSQDAFRQAAEGLTNTHEQVALGRFVDRAYGKYGKFSPKERQWIALYTPFGAWTLNAVRFLTSVLPRDHPVLTSLLASATQASEDWRKLHGLTQSNALGVTRVPQFLQNSIPGGDGSHLSVGKYTPFGFGTDPLGTVASAFLPQASGVLNAFQGRKFTGAPLRDKNGQPSDPLHNFLFALGEAAGSELPAVGTATRIIKAPGGTGNKLRVLGDPFKFTKGHATSGGGGSSSVAHPAWGTSRSSAHRGWGTGGATASRGWGTR